MSADQNPTGAADRSHADRRRDLRVPIIIERVRIDDDRRTFFGYAKSISRGGMFIAATSPRERGEVFEVSIPLPAPIDRTVVCSCEVVWSRPWSKGATHEPGMGLKFLDLPPDVAADIDHWIEKAVLEERLRRVPGARDQDFPG